MSREPHAALLKGVDSREGAVWLSDESSDHEKAANKTSNPVVEAMSAADPTTDVPKGPERRYQSVIPKARPVRTQRQVKRRRATPSHYLQREQGHQYHSTLVHDDAQVLQGNYHNHNIAIVATTSSSYSSPTMAYAAGLLGSATGSFAYAAAKDYHSTPGPDYAANNARRDQVQVASDEASPMQTSTPRAGGNRRPDQRDLRRTIEYPPTKTSKWRPEPGQVPIPQGQPVHQFAPSVPITRRWSPLSTSRALVADDLKIPSQPIWKPVPEEQPMIDRGSRANVEQDLSGPSGAKSYSHFHTYEAVTINDLAPVHMGGCRSAYPGPPPRGVGGYPPRERVHRYSEWQAEDKKNESRGANEAQDEPQKKRIKTRDF